MLPRQHRLASSRDFKTVFASGRTYVHRLFILKVLPTAGERPTRFAFSTSAKLGKAVARNRAKRLLREAVRLLGGRVRQGRDVVLVARPPMRDAKLGEVLRAVEELFQKVSLLEDRERT